eukprot:gene4059-7348_t
MINIVLFIVLFAFGLWTINTIIHLLGYTRYPGSFSFLPRFLPKIPIINPDGMKKFHETDIELRKQNPDLSNYPFLSMATPTMQRFVVSDANVVKELFLNSAKEFPKPQDRMEKAFGIYGPNILTENGESWRKHRLLCNPAFSKKNLELLTTVSHFATTKEMESWKENESIDVNEAMNNITLEIILKAGFGYNLDNKIKIGEYTFKENVKMIIDSLIYIFLAPGFVRSFLSMLPFKTKETKVNNVIKDFEAYVDEIIKKHENSNDLTLNYDLLSLLLTSKDEEQVLTQKEVKADSFIFLLAGHDTTSSQLSWSLFELAKRPEMQEKIFNEVKSIDSTKEPTLEDYESLEYTSWIVNESLRLHPPIQGVIKTNSKKRTFHGEKYDLTVPANETFLINILSLHTDERYWDEPMEFNPERWSKPIKNKCAYLPFSMGSRKCIGSTFSLIESNIILATIVKNFKVVLEDESFVPKSQFGIVAKPSDLQLKFQRRK